MHALSRFAFAAAMLGNLLTAPASGQPTTAPPNPAIARELAALRAENASLIGKLIGDPRAAARIRITYLGKGKTQPADFSEPRDVPGTGPGAPAEGFVAFNPGSGNEFMIAIPADVLRRIGTAALRTGLNKPGISTPAAPERPRPTSPTTGERSIPLLHSASWSGGVDNRTRLSSLTAGTTRWVWRAIADLGGCTATMVGPRHAITAGHCIYNRANSAWNTGFNVTPGRAGANWNYDRALVPSAPFTWYFTPVGWRQANPPGGTGQFDIGILVISKRLGDATSWMGWWNGSDTYLQSTPIWNRGFPLCASTANGVARADDPGDPGSSVTCTASHLYGDPSPCSIGNFSRDDGTGWTRRLAHGCDASAGQSGSPLYLFRDNTPYVTAIHTTSSCGMFANSTQCTASDTRPLTATRITPEYSARVAYFRAWKP